MKKRFAKCITESVAVVLLFAGISAAAWAEGTAQISGNVRDQTGAVLPGVEVTARVK